VALLEGGHFDGSDVVFITHPADRWSLDQRFLAMKRAMFVFQGKAVALSAYEMLTQPEKLKAVQEGFKAAKSKEGK
jgi:hypothetical protein